MNKITVFEIEQITPGARHVWLRTSVGRIRKPVGEVRPEKFNFELDEKIVLVEKRLQHWGRWLLQSLTNGIGYPSQSTLVTALQGSPATSRSQQPDDPEAEEVERAVKQIQQTKKLWADVLNKHYTRDLDAKATDVAKAMDIPSQTYFYYLNLGRKSVEKFLKAA